MTKKEKELLTEVAEDFKNISGAEKVVITVTDENGKEKRVKIPKRGKKNDIPDDDPSDNAPYKIKSAIITGYTLAVKYEIRKPGGTHDKIDKTSEDLIHQDMRTAFLNLVPHLILVCDQKGSETLVDGDKLVFTEPQLQELEYRVQGFHIKKDGYILIGEKYFEGKTIAIISPLIDRRGKYKHLTDLVASMEDCIGEVAAYVFENKYASEQGRIDFDKDNDVPE